MFAASWVVCASTLASVVVAGPFNLMFDEVKTAPSPLLLLAKTAPSPLLLLAKTAPSPLLLLATINTFIQLTIGGNKKSRYDGCYEFVCKDLKFRHNGWGCKINAQQHKSRKRSDCKFKTQHYCVCPESFTGYCCEKKVEWCKKEGTAKCKNGATCIDGLMNTKFSCKCPKGFKGKYCEEATDECNPNPCQNGGVCKDKHLDFDCTCQGCDKNWESSNGNGCKEYSENKWCRKDGDHYGSGWKEKWGRMETYADGEGRTAKVCPQCGCTPTEWSGKRCEVPGQKHFDCNATWSDYKGKGCKYYESRKWCKKGGDHYGSKWPKERGTFEMWWDGGKRKSDPYGIWPIAGTGANARVCPQCGCREGQGVWITPPCLPWDHELWKFRDFADASNFHLKGADFAIWLADYYKFTKCFNGLLYMCELPCLHKGCIKHPGACVSSAWSENSTLNFDRARPYLWHSGNKDERYYQCKSDSDCLNHLEARDRQHRGDLPCPALAPNRVFESQFCRYGFYYKCRRHQGRNICHTSKTRNQKFWQYTAYWRDADPLELSDGRTSEFVPCEKDADCDLANFHRGSIKSPKLEGNSHLWD